MKHYNRPHPGPTMGAPKQNPEAYRGYLICFSAFSNTMWIEQGCALIANVPANESWAWARRTIDALIDG